MGSIIENLFWVSIMIVLGFIVRKMTGSQLGVLWRKILWEVLAVRLLIPFQVSSGKESIFLMSAGLSYTGAVRNGLISSHLIKQGQYTTAKNGLILHMPVLYVVLCISFAVSIFLIFRHHEQYGFAINDFCASLQDTGKYAGKMRVYVGERVTSPMIFGYRNPVLLLPKREIREEELKFILDHECAHYRMRDLWYKRLILLVNDVYWFNPLLYLMRRMAYEDVELYCDEVVTARYNEQEKGRYCEVVLNLAAGVTRDNHFALEFAGNTKRLKERIRAVFEKKNLKAGFIVLAVFLVSLLACEGMMEVVVANPPENGIYEVSESTIRDVMRACEKRLNLLGEFGQVTIRYSYDLNRPAYSKEELNENLRIVISSSRYEELSDLMRESIGDFVNSYFGWELETVVVTGE